MNDSDDGWKKFFDAQDELVVEWSDIDEELVKKMENDPFYNKSLRKKKKRSQSNKSK